MHLLWLLLFGTAVYGISRISQPSLEAVNYAKAIEGMKLNGSVIKETEVDSEISCQFECVAEQRCKSYNFGAYKNNAKKFKCQLSDSDRFVDRGNFIKNERFRYRGIQVKLSLILLVFSAKVHGVIFNHVFNFFIKVRYYYSFLFNFISYFFLLFHSCVKIIACK